MTASNDNATFSCKISKNKVTDENLPADVTVARAMTVENATVPPPKPLIPGLPESERLKKKSRKKKTKNNSEGVPSPGKLKAVDFLSSTISVPRSPDVAEEFVFSEYEDDDTDSGDDKFEDTLEQINDGKNSDGNSRGPLFSASKRSARSPADQKDNKKQRGIHASL